MGRGALYSVDSVYELFVYEGEGEGEGKKEEEEIDKNT